MEIPPEVMARYNAVNARAEDVAQRPFQAYSNDPNAFVAPLNATQQAGIQNTNMMAGAAQPFYQNAAGLTAAGAQNVNPQALNINQFYNPYTQAVADTTMQALQQQQGMERSNLVNPQTAKSFGGDRSGLVAANLARQQNMATAQAMAPIYQKAFADSLSAAQQQQGVGLAAEQANANRALQAGAQFGQLGTGYQQAGLAGAQAQLAAGQTQQQTNQAGLQALYNQFQQQQAYPAQIAQFLANIALGTGTASGNTTYGTMIGGGGFFSDERLKENIEKVGETNDGQNIYRYNYKGDPRTQIGLLAQEVAQDHPDAVGKRDGYLTVDYRDATDDAVRDRKADGGAENGMAAYNINAPSAMLKPMQGLSPMMAPGAMVSPIQAGLGAINFPKMVSGADIPIQPGAINPADQGLLAPKATGFSLGSKAAAEAELATLKGADLSKSQSGKDYFDYKTKALEDFLSDYNKGLSSQGGLVSGPGAFSRGGYAEAGYVNPALAFYGSDKKPGLGSGGPYGAVLPPLGQFQLARGPELKFPQQRSGVEQANQIANLTTKGYELYKNRPEWMGGKPSETTTSKGDNAAKPPAAPAPGGTSTVEKTVQRVSDASIDPEILRSLDPSLGATFVARGGLIGRHPFSTDGYVSSGDSPYGSSEKDKDENKGPEAPNNSSALGSTLTTDLQKYTMATPGKMDMPQQSSGLQDASKAVGLMSAGKNLMGTLGKLGSAGAAGAGAAGAGAGAAGAAGAGAAGAAGAGAAGAAGASGLLGTLGSIAGTAGSVISSILPFLPFLASDRRMKHDVERVGRLNDGQPVYRFKYDGDDRTRMGLMAQDVEKYHPEAVRGLGGVKMVDYAAATDEAAGLAPRQRFQDAGVVAPVDENGRPIVREAPAARTEPPAPVPSREAPAARAEPPAPVPPREIPAKPRTEEAPRRSFSIPDVVGDAASGIGKAASGLGGLFKEKDETFWVPAIAGLGSMLASRNPTLLGAIGEGLVGGTSAYTGLQKQTADQLKQRFDIAKTIFKGPTMNSKGEFVWEDTRRGDMIDQAEYERRYSEFMRGAGTGGSALPSQPPVRREEPSAVTTARDVVVQPAPQREPARAATTTPPAAAAGPAAAVTPPAAATPVVAEGERREAATASTTPAAPAAATEETRQPTILEMRRRAFENEALWANTDPSRNPRVLLPQVNALDQTIKSLEEQAAEANRLAARASERNPQQGQIYQGQATNLLAQAERLRKERDDKSTIAQKSIDDAVALEVKAAESRTAKDVEREYTEEYDPLTGAKVQLPPGQKLPRPTAPQPTEEQKRAPKEATVDPKTGQLTLARPVAPAGGGRLLPNLPEGARITGMPKEAEDQMALDRQFLEDFKLPAVNKALDRYLALVNGFKTFESGATANTRGGWASLAQTFGLPDIAQKIAMGDPEGIEWVNKVGPNLVLADLKEATPRFAQSEFTTLSDKGTPEPNKLPGVNFQMVKEGLAALNRTKAFILSWDRASREEGWRSPSAYYNEWSRLNPPEAFLKAAERQMGTFAGMKLPKAEEWTPGAVYVVPGNLAGEQRAFFEKRGLKAGDAFQYGGEDAPPDSVIVPIPRQQLYSMPAVRR
jgi:hypothetical protein